MFFECREKILEYRDESQRLDQCSRLYDSSVSSEGFELDASHIFQVLLDDIYFMYQLIFSLAASFLQQWILSDSMHAIWSQ